ncbi:glycoside hydrolase family 3 N-terminal domain-containing protein [Amycolatopsis granulosa]|uniref:glycoside hydrolase family 3 N-terminal domain-containing protein n=1 Tax=Amycolatopsis granulosa TaxID=185684 RepID=UPI0014216568|nr:glycoside hydrolase family 3 N-terminal domain-containing protein [Amycolatopsis granulosa]NIH85945.1 beta-N-acetylhexosaminidase [Amycolatopsis granulosa]
MRPAQPLTRRLLLVLAAGALLTAGVVYTGGDEADQQVPAAPPAPQPRISAVNGPDACATVISQLTPRQRMAQLVVVGVDAADPRATTDLVRSEQVGGIFLGGNATALLENKALDEVQRAARVPVSVAVDDEGGRVQRIDDLDGSMPSARRMAATLTPAQVRDLARDRGRAMAARGVTTDYAPVLDLTDAAADEVIGDRSFSADPATARRYAQAFAAGLSDSGVQPVLKHFPGHGHATGDSHKGSVTTPPLSQLRDADLLPYRNIGDFGNAAVMVGHLEVPDLTGGEPASLSPAAYQLLRGDFGFRGPILTDDLGAMKAITQRYPLPQAVVKALQSGADQALWSSGGRVSAVLDALEQASTDGTLPGNRVTDALTTVLRAKHAC